MNSPLSYAVVIPARFESSRFPGKPLADICGKPMIRHVWNRCVDAVGGENVFVATDSAKIAEVVESFGGQVLMTSPQCKTGTDRVAEANQQLTKDFIINVQGDEPLVEPKSIIAVKECFERNPSSVINAFCKLSDSEDVSSTAIPKVVVSKSKKLLYISRAAIPRNKEGVTVEPYKQVCIYAFSASQLKFFFECKDKTPLEEIEDIEIIRFLENDFSVQMIEVQSGSLAVDFPSDIVAVEKLIEATN